ncbi:MFS transporter [Serratia rubidaea]|uniref:MFS transporter n=1 Tax=Serratia rubidaea TaxID=61652 RepID=UPI00177C2917|nr:MFS transporter [Serratia rubidaea]MBD8452081.1 MFS transporter [Serratia rubidaea]
MNSAMVPAKTKTRGLMQPAFIRLWLSETVMDFGAALMSFALGVWIFQNTGSPERFAWAVLAAAIPALIMTPLAGALADRFNRRWVILGCDLLSIVMVLALMILMSMNILAVKYLYAFNAVSALINTMRTPAYQAAVSTIVPNNKLTQASGLIGLSQSVLQIVAPLIAGFVVGRYGIGTIISLNMLMVIAAALAAFSGLSRAKYALVGVKNTAGASLAYSVKNSFTAMLDYFGRYRLMLGAAGYTFFQDSLLMLVTAMLVPFVLSTHSSATLGLVLACGAVGGVSGSLLLVTSSINSRLMVRVMQADFFLALLIILIGFSSSALVWSLCAFLAFFFGSISSACTQAIWMKKTPEAVRGSVLAWITSANLFGMCIATLTGGVLSERVFEPALSHGGAWSETLGLWVGTGPGRGLGLLFMLSGSIGCAIALIAWINGRLPRLDGHIPDAEATAGTSALPGDNQ